MTEDQEELTLVFNSKSKSGQIPSAMKIARMHPHEIKDDGYCHVVLVNDDPDILKLLDLVDGLKGTLLIDQNGRKFKSKEQYEQETYRDALKTGLDSLTTEEHRLKADRDAALNLQRLKDSTHLDSLITEEQRSKADRDAASNLQRLKNSTRKQFKSEMGSTQKRISNLGLAIERKKGEYERAKKEARKHLTAFITGACVHIFITILPMLAMGGWNVAVSIGVSIVVFHLFGTVFGLMCPDKYRSWEKATIKAGSAKKEMYVAQRELANIVKNSSPDIPPVILSPDTIDEVLKKTYRIKMEDMREILGMDQATFDAAIVDMAIEFGFWIDGDHLAFDEGNHTAFMDRVKQLNNKHVLMGKIAGAMNGSRRVPLKDIQDITCLEARALDERVIDWAIQFGFKIDGDELVLDPEKAAGFITVLQTFSP